MKTLYININNEQVQSTDELEVFNYDLTDGFFFTLGEKIANGAPVNEQDLVKNFNTEENKNDFQKIMEQWNRLKIELFSEEAQGTFEIILPESYIHWLRYNSEETYRNIYNSRFSGDKLAVIIINIEEFYEEYIEQGLLYKIARKISKGDFEHIVFNDKNITIESLVVHNIKDKFEKMGFIHFENFGVESESGEDEAGNKDSSISKTESCEIASDDISDIDIVIEWLCDEVYEERGLKWKNDPGRKRLRSLVAPLVERLYRGEKSISIKIPFALAYFSDGQPSHTAIFEREITAKMLYKLRHPEEVEDFTWGWETVNYLDSELKIKKHNNKFGLVDYDDIIILPCEYDEIMELKSGNIRILKNGKYGIINADKTINIPCLYDELYDFQNGLCKVKKDDKYYKLDSQGIKRMLRKDDLWSGIWPDGNEDSELTTILKFFPVCDIILGRTNIRDLDRQKIEKGEFTFLDEHYKEYAPKLNDDILFYQIDGEDYISTLAIKYLSSEYLYVKGLIDKNKATLRQVNGMVPDSATIYTTNDLVLKILIYGTKGLFIEYSANKRHKFINTLTKNLHLL